MRRRSVAFTLLIAAVTCAWMLLASTAASAASTEPISFEAYVARVDAALVTVKTALPDVADTVMAQGMASRVAMLLPDGLAVTNGEQTMYVDGSVLHTLVLRVVSATSAAERTDATERLLAHLASIERAAGVVSAPPLPENRAALASILARGQVAARESLAHMLGRLAERASAWFGEVWSHVVARPGAATTVETMFYLLLALAAGIVVWILTRVGLHVWRQRSRREGEPATPPEQAVSADRDLSPAGTLARADELAAGGRFRDALRTLFAAAVRDLVARGAVRQARTRTAGQIVDEAARTAPSARTPLRVLADLFERAWFGHDDPGAEGYARARELYERLGDALAHPMDES